VLVIETRSRRYQGTSRCNHRVETLKNELWSIVRRVSHGGYPRRRLSTSHGKCDDVCGKSGGGQERGGGQVQSDGQGMFRLCQLPIACRRGKVLRLDVLYSVFRSNYTTSFTRPCSTSVVIRSLTSTTSSSPQLDSQHRHCSCYLGHSRRSPTRYSYESKQWMQ